MWEVHNLIKFARDLDHRYLDHPQYKESSKSTGGPYQISRKLKNVKKRLSRAYIKHTVSVKIDKTQILHF